MARKSADGVNRSQLIRDYKKTNKKMGPKAIAEAMNKDHGVEISPQYVSTVLSTAKRKGGKIGRPGRRPSGGDGSVSLDTAKLLKAKEFMTLMGSAADAKAAITLIERLL
jgi:hypothetical protein